jgi:maltose O-acetyltransferase
MTRRSMTTSNFVWRLVVNDLAAAAWMPRRARGRLYSIMGLAVRGDGIWPGCYFRTSNVSLGLGTTVNVGCRFDNRAGVSIGDRCGIGMGVTFLTSTHDLTDPNCRAGAGSLLPIAIGDGVWVGSAATILPGVTIGHGCVIAAGAVVNRDCLADHLYAGVPARQIKKLL